jgi:hypothetical protein
MKIKNILNNIFNPSDSKNKGGKIESDDSYCYSRMVWNSKDNLIILLSFTEDYFPQIIELQDAMLKKKVFQTKIIFSSYDENTGKVDEDGNEVLIIHKKYYILIGAAPKHWQLIYTEIHDLGNEALSKITDEITNNCCSSDFYQIIEDGIVSNFKYNNIYPKYDVNCSIGEYTYTDPKTVLARLPEAFTAKEVLRFIMVYNSHETFCFSARDELYYISEITQECFEKEYGLNQLFTDLFGENITVEKLSLFIEPLYKQPDDDTLPGDLDDASLDDIFREEYDRFSAVIDSNIYYEDIDEALSNDEESENMKPEDVISDY